ncbi:hypothetical protein DSM112329_05371 [Paraconexibacter sp. AEG42_29]|uniref:Tyrosinase copper-binding domain-containing protein n=1 Tax=Paraconexibacter sp. AEG42_29 TaxID=2997339 RepID=A0AAU7B3G6_9ACTN
MTDSGGGAGRRRTGRLGAALVVLAALGGSAAAPANAATCPTQLRKEIRTLSADELSRYAAAVKTLTTGPAPTAYDKLVKIHLDSARNIHFYAEFLPWHRRFIRNFEKALQLVDPSVTVPYWDAGLDASKAASAPVFGAGAFGGDGVVKTGLLPGLKPRYPAAHALTRDFSFAPPTFRTSAQMVQLLAGAKTYDAVRSAIETTQHGLVHMAVGGDLAQNSSPNDPLFWLLHSYIDKLWADWQQKNPTLAATYAGRNANGTMAKPADRLTTLNVAASSVFDTRNMCYVYQPVGAAPAPAATTTPPPATGTTSTTTTTTTTTTPTTATTPTTTGTTTATTPTTATGTTAATTPTTTTSARISGLRARLRQAAAPQLIPTSIALAADRSAVTPGATVTLTATVGTSDGAGAVRFAIDGVPADGCAAVPLQFTGVTWQATCRATPAGSGIGQVSADFLGAGAFAPSRTELSGGLTVGADVATIRFTPPPDTTYGTPINPGDLDATASRPGSTTYTFENVGVPGLLEVAKPDLVLDAGQYNLVARFVPADGSPAQEATVATRVHPATLTIRPESKDMVTGDLIPQLTWIASGFLDGDTPTVLLQQPTCQVQDAPVDDPDARLAVGTHTIRCAGGLAANYEISYPTTAKVTVRRRPCSPGAVCATDAPPSPAQREANEEFSFVCRPPLPITRRQKLEPTENTGGETVDVWRGRVT